MASINPAQFPDFLVIGAAKAGTTSLHYYLMQHPEIFMPAAKEPTFFYFEGHKIDFAGDYDNQVWEELAVRDLESYQTLFKEAGHRIKGEISTNYLYYHASVAQRIYDYNPAMKLIAILRNPVDRAFSAFRHRRRDYREPIASFQDALSAESERIANRWDASAHYFRAGLYSAALETYFRIFPPEQIRLYIYEADIRDNLDRTLAELFDFLEVDSEFQVDSSESHNAHGELQNPVLRGLHKTLLYHDFIQNTARRLPDWLTSPIRNAMYTLRQADEKQVVLSHSLRCHLEQAYREDILKTASLIKRDLSIWFSDDCS